jgi:hypothetical protein
MTGLGGCFELDLHRSIGSCRCCLARINAVIGKSARIAEAAA